MEANGRIKLFDFGQSEVDGVVAAVRPFPLGKFFRDVRNRIEVDVVKNDGHSVLGKDEILLDEVGALGVRHGFGRETVFGEIAAGPAMSQDHGLDGKEGTDEGGGKGEG